MGKEFWVKHWRMVDMCMELQREVWELRQKEKEKLLLKQVQEMRNEQRERAQALEGS